MGMVVSRWTSLPDGDPLDVAVMNTRIRLSINYPIPEGMSGKVNDDDQVCGLETNSNGALSRPASSEPDGDCHGEGSEPEEKTPPFSSIDQEAHSHTSNLEDGTVENS